MTGIQALLILAICLLFVVSSRSLKYQAAKRLLFSLLFIIGLVLILLPEVATHIAHLLGIGRGADLLLYFGIVGGFLVSILMYSKIRQLESQITHLVRKQAILTAKTPQPGLPSPPKHQSRKTET